MVIGRASAVIVLALVIAGVSSERLTSGAAPPPRAALAAFVGARVIDGTGRPPIENATILVREGRIEAIGPASAIKLPMGIQPVALAGRTVVPGLINAHGHVGETRGLQSGPEQYSRENVLSQLGLYARYGVTTVVSLGGDREPGFALRDAQHVATLDRSRLYVAGPVIAAKTAEEGRTLVDQVAAMKPDFIKIRVDDNLGTSAKMPPEVYRAIIGRAHEKGVKVAAHLFYLEDAKGLLDAGVDFLVHSVRDQEVDAGLIDAMKTRDVCLCPTLTREVSAFVYESTPAFFTDPFFTREADPRILSQLEDPKRQESVRTSRSAQQYKAALEVASRNVKKLADAGVRIAFGTDTGPPARFQGYFEHMELELMSKAGLTPSQVLVAATGDAARCSGLAGKVGTLAPGAWADLVVLEKNPLEDVRHFRTIASVWIAGNRVPPQRAGTAQ